MAVDSDTERAVRAFLERISDRYPVIGARLYGSRARADHALDSDADVAVLLKGPRGDPLAVGVEMAGVAFDVLLDMEIWVSRFGRTTGGIRKHSPIHACSRTFDAMGSSCERVRAQTQGGAIAGRRPTVARKWFYGCGEQSSLLHHV